jgi:cytidyltransferase-like protein
MKLVPSDWLAEIGRHVRRDGGIVVQAAGCWDLLHIGHIKHLQVAKSLGNVLVVSVTSDRYVNKGTGRPRFPSPLRADSVAALDCVDYVHINDEPNVVAAIKLLKPHVYIKGSEYKDCGGGS